MYLLCRVDAINMHKLRFTLSLLCGMKYKNHVDFEGFFNVFHSEIFIYIMLGAFMPNYQRTYSILNILRTQQKTLIEK